MAGHEFDALRGPAQGTKSLHLQVRSPVSVGQGMREALGIDDGSRSTPISPRNKAVTPRSRPDLVLPGETRRNATPTKGNRPLSPRSQKRSGKKDTYEIRSPSISGTDSLRGSGGGMFLSNIVSGIHRGFNPDGFDCFASTDAQDEDDAGPWSSADDFLDELHNMPGISESKEEFLLRCILARGTGEDVFRTAGEVEDQREEAKADVRNFIDDIFRKAWQVMDTAVSSKRRQLEHEISRDIHKHFKQQAESVHRFIAQRDNTKGDMAGTQEAIDNKMYVPLQRLDESHRGLIAVCVESIVKSTFQDAMQGKQTLLHGWLRQQMSRERTSISESQEHLISQLTDVRKEVSQLHTQLNTARLESQVLEQDSLRFREVQEMARASITPSMRRTVRQSLKAGPGHMENEKQTELQWKLLLASIAQAGDSDDEGGETSEDEENQQEKAVDIKDEVKPLEKATKTKDDESSPRRSVKLSHQATVAGDFTPLAGTLTGEESATKAYANNYKRSRTCPGFAAETVAGDRRKVRPSFCLDNETDDVAEDSPKHTKPTPERTPGRPGARYLIRGLTEEEDGVEENPANLMTMREEALGGEAKAEVEVDTQPLAAEQSEEQASTSTQICAHCGRSLASLDVTLESNTSFGEPYLGTSATTSENPTIVDFEPDVQTRPVLPGSTAAALMAHAKKLYDELGKPWQFGQCAELLRVLESLGEQLDKEVEEEAIAVHMDVNPPASVTLLTERLHAVRGEVTVLRSVCTGLVATVGKLFEIASTKATLQLRLGMMERQLYEIIVTCRPRLLQCFAKARQGWLRLEEPRLAARAAATKPGSSNSDLRGGVFVKAGRARPMSSSDDFFAMSPFMSNDTMGSVDSLWGSSEAFVTSRQLSKVDIGVPPFSSRAGCPSPEMPRRSRDGQRLQGDVWDESLRVEARNARSKSRSHSPAESLRSSPQTSIAPRWSSAADCGKGNDSNLSPKPFLPYCSMLSSLGCGDSPAKPAMRQVPPSQRRDRSIEDEVAKVRRQLLPAARSSTPRATSTACKEDASSSAVKPTSVLPPTAPHPLRREAASLPVSTRLRRLHVS